MVPTSSQNRAIGRPWSSFFRFCEVLEGCIFLMSFWFGKSWSTNCKNKICGGHGGFPGELLGGSASRAVPVELFRAVPESWMNSGIGFYTLVPWQAGGSRYIRTPP